MANNVEFTFEEQQELYNIIEAGLKQAHKDGNKKRIRILDRILNRPGVIPKERR